MIKNKILFVEDDADVIVWIEEYLKEYRFEVTTVDTVTDAISHIKQHSYDIILLDLNLPDFFGYEVLKFVNENFHNLPIIVISAYADMKNKLHAFHLGASDYMVKPLNLEELEARIRVHTKTKQINKEEPTKNTKFVLEENQILLDNIPLKLTRTEFKILKVLIQNKNSTINREKLCESISSISSQRALDYHILNIRKKIGDNISNPTYLITEYGLGYRLVV